MRLAVSNIGWTEAEDATILPRLRDAGADAVEVAPGRIFADVSGATVAQAEAVGADYRTAGLPIVSMQALLFGRPGVIFAEVLGSGPEHSKSPSDAPGWPCTVYVWSATGPAGQRELNLFHPGSEVN